MSYNPLNDLDLYGIQRGKINSMFSELYTVKIQASQVLTRTNTSVYTPTANYHPATKLYVDSLWSSFQSVYNPQSINADIFARANHTGTQAPATIATDSNNRFVTDAEKATWNGKEPAIGAKGTAFNKNFGTGHLDVPYGDHTHNKADIGLGNVDNTSDVNKPVSTAQAAAIALKASKRESVTVQASTYTVTGFASDKLDIYLDVSYTSTGAVTITINSDHIINNRHINILDIGGNATINNITVNTQGSETINGNSNLVIIGDYSSITLRCKNGNIYIV